jgi:hypothetical protein
MTTIINIHKAFFADDDELKISTMDWLEGANQASLNNPDEIVISSFFKEVLFGNEQAVAKYLDSK